MNAQGSLFRANTIIRLVTPSKSTRFFTIRHPLQTTSTRKIVYISNSGCHAGERKNKWRVL